MITDPTTPPDPVPTPPALPGPRNPLNPLLLPNVISVGAYCLAAIALVGMIALAVVYDGAYTQAAFEICRDVILLAMGTGGATGLAHVLTRRNPA